MATFKVEWREAGEVHFEEDTVTAKTTLNALQAAADKDGTLIDFEMVCDVRITELS